VRRASDHLEELVRTLPVHRVYADLDGTLLGPGGSLFAHPSGVTIEAARAITSMSRAGIGLVLVSGRTRDQVREAARILGAAAYVAEMGGLVVHREDQEEVLIRNWGPFSGKGTPQEAIARSGAAGFLLTEFAGRLEPHTPWSSLPRECSVLLRGEVSAAEVTSTLERAGYGWLELLDNGILAADPERFPTLEVTEVRAYHLLPKGVNKATAVAIDRERLGLDPAECIAVGDSASDVTAADQVGAVLMVANGEPAVAGLPLAENVYLMDRSHGLGFADAVEPFVAERTSERAEP
jgi:hydroxymethylpyrimidine pyrophosphatase-like HAD family hydrolase